MNRIRGGIEYKRTTEGGTSWDGTYKIEGDETENPGALFADNAGNISWAIGSPALTMSCQTCGFKIFGDKYPVNDFGGAVVSVLPSHEPRGSIRIDNCQILQRSALGDFGNDLFPDIEGLGNDPILVEVEGVFNSSMKILTDSGNERGISVKGHFVYPLAVSLTGDRTELNKYLEESCLCDMGNQK